MSRYRGESILAVSILLALLAVGFFSLARLGREKMLQHTLKIQRDIARPGPY